MVALLTPSTRARWRTLSPWARSFATKDCWAGDSFGRRPSLTPRAFARTRPSLVRERMRSRSNSARPPNTVSMSRPCDVVVFAHVSRTDRNCASFSARAASTLSRSRVDRAKRSRRVTISTSPAWSEAIARFSCVRSVFAPEAVSLNTFSQPAAVSSATCAATLWPSVETRAYPQIIRPILRL